MFINIINCMLSNSLLRPNRWIINGVGEGEIWRLTSLGKAKQVIPPLKTFLYTPLSSTFYFSFVWGKRNMFNLFPSKYAEFVWVPPFHTPRNTVRNRGTTRTNLEQTISNELLTFLNVSKELSLCHKLWFSNPYIFATQ